MKHNCPLLILGMHRSGTSCLAGSLEAAGLYLGSVNTAAPFNKRGNREHEAIREIHDAVFESSGYSWDHPPTKQLDWSKHQIKQLANHAEQLSHVPNWGLKDPRSAFCLEGWRTVFDPRYVATYRHPVSVANSLVARSIAWQRPMKQEAALQLWLSYNEQILMATSGLPVQFVRYDVAPEEYSLQLKMVCESHDLDSRLANTFYSSSLQNHHAQNSRIPAECERIWSELEARRQQPRIKQSAT